MDSMRLNAISQWYSDAAREAERRSKEDEVHESAQKRAKIEVEGQRQVAREGFRLRQQQLQRDYEEELSQID
ncbi:MAG: hypothetical protein M1818_007306 [Claussenomyces sp. TS43310]|nr:MAG: hypothetical protein M1818_007306 [Claussenomyces sp. TS43310]